MPALAALLVFAFAAAAAAAAKEQRILVGDDPGALLTPAHANLTAGDTVAFTFWTPGANFSVVQSSRTRACAALEGGFDSGWVQSTRDDIKVFRMFFTKDEPIFYYALNGSATAAEPQKCTERMFGSINASPTQISAYKTLADDVTAFPLGSPVPGVGSPAGSTGSLSLPASPSASAKNGGKDGRHKDGDGNGGLSTGATAAIAICALLGAGAVVWLVRRRRARRRAAERRPPRDPPPAYVASISAASGSGSGMAEVWEEVGGRRIMRAPSVTSQPGAHTHTFTTASSTTGRTPSSSDRSATLDTNPFASPEDDETVTLRSSSRPTTPSGEDEDAPPEYMSSHSVPPPFSAVARR